MSNNLAPLTGIEDLEEEIVMPAGQRDVTCFSTKYDGEYSTANRPEPVPTILLSLRYDDPDGEIDYAPAWARIYLPHDGMESHEQRQAARTLKRAAAAFNLELDDGFDPEQDHALFKDREGRVNVAHRAAANGETMVNVNFPRFGAAA